MKQIIYFILLMSLASTVQSQNQLTFSSKYISFAELIDKEDDPYGVGMDNRYLLFGISYDKLVNYFKRHNITDKQRTELKINTLKHPLLRSQPNSDIVHANTIYQSEKGRIEIIYTKKNVSEYIQYYKVTIKRTIVYEYIISYNSQGNYISSILSGRFRFSYSPDTKEMTQDDGGEFIRLTTKIKDYKNILQEEDSDMEISYYRYMLTPSLLFQKNPFKENESSSSF